MSVSPYINFRSSTREAVAFYAKAFGAPAPRIMAFGDMPPDPAFPMDEAAKKLVMHAEVQIAGSTVMFSDVPPQMPLTQGDSITLIVQTDKEAEIKAWFAALAQGGTVKMALGPQPWAPLYGYLVDKFGVGWQFSQVK